jgi:hypothetical protein
MLILIFLKSSDVPVLSLFLFQPVFILSFFVGYIPFHVIKWLVHSKI